MCGKITTYTVLVGHDMYSSDVSMVHARVHATRMHDPEVAHGVHAPGWVELRSLTKYGAGDVFIEICSLHITSVNTSNCSKQLAELIVC